METGKSDKITKAKLEKYGQISKKAYSTAKKHIAKSKKTQAEEILKMAKCYIDDSDHFKGKGDYVNAFAALNYAHGWLDTGARLGIFKVTDNRLFTVQ